MKLTKEQLQELIRAGLTGAQIAEKLHVSRRTIHRYCKRYDLHVSSVGFATGAVCHFLFTAGNRLAVILAERGISTYTLGDRCGISYQRVRRFLYGGQALDVWELKRVCDYLRISLSEFFSGL